MYKKYIQKTNSPKWVCLSKLVEIFDFQTWENNIVQDVPIYFLIFFEVFLYKKSYKYGVHGPKNDQ